MELFKVLIAAFFWATAGAFGSQVDELRLRVEQRNQLALTDSKGGLSSTSTKQLALDVDIRRRKDELKRSGIPELTRLADALQLTERGWEVREGNNQSRDNSAVVVIHPEETLSFESAKYDPYTQESPIGKCTVIRIFRGVELVGVVHYKGAAIFLLHVARTEAQEILFQILQKLRAQGGKHYFEPGAVRVEIHRRLNDFLYQRFFDLFFWSSGGGRSWYREPERASSASGGCHQIVGNSGSAQISEKQPASGQIPRSSTKELPGH